MTYPDRVHACLQSAIRKDAFDAKAFFRSWFRDNGHSFFFLFRKNLKVTNLQVAELHALLRTHVRNAETGLRLRDFQLLSVQEFNDAVRSLVSSFADGGQVENATRLVSELYSGLLQDVVCVQLYFGSCVVFLPCSMKVDVLPICAESGYIHSCGPSILNRNIAKATKQEFFDRLTAHLNARRIERAKLVVYAHEDFTRHDRQYAHELKDGLDDVKIHAEKYYVGKDSLVQTLKDLHAHDGLGARLDIAEPTHFARHERVGDMPVIWLLVDRRPGSDLRTRSDDQYYILYQQLYKNENIFHLFDENKPAWVDHTTIPHTLTAAMINLTRPWWPEKRKPLLVDPFVGSGTSWLEAVRRGLSAWGVDTDELVEQMARDNLEFFSLTPDALFRLNAAVWVTTWMRNTRLDTGGDADRARRQELSDKYDVLIRNNDFWKDVEADYDWARDFFMEVCPDQHRNEIAIQEKHLDRLSQVTLCRRVLFYLTLRTHRRKLAAIERESLVWGQAYRSEALQLAEQMEELQELLGRRRPEELVQADGRAYAVFAGTYSLSCSTPLNQISSAHQTEDFKKIRRADARDCAELRQPIVDLIVSDPPYGLNAEHNPRELAQLFQSVLERMIAALANGGQLVLALPDWSHIGKQVPFFATRQFMTQAVLATAERHGREVVTTAHALPTPAEAFRAPWYWESDRALRRAIVHFRFKTLDDAVPGGAL